MARGEPPKGRLNAPDIRQVPVYIYALTDPDGTVRYVGRSQSPKVRYRAHHCESSGLVFEWLQSLVSAGHRAGLLILHVVPPGEDATPHEVRLIAEHSETSFNIMGARFSMPRAERERISAAANRMRLAVCARREAVRARRRNANAARGIQ